MKATRRFVAPCGSVVCTMENGATIILPVLPGILKHPTTEQLHELLTDPIVVRKYTAEALSKAPWDALRHFPREWLRVCLSDVVLPESRRKALELLLG